MSDVGLENSGVTLESEVQRVFGDGRDPRTLNADEIDHLMVEAETPEVVVEAAGLLRNVVGPVPHREITGG